MRLPDPIANTTTEDEVSSKITGAIEDNTIKITSYDTSGWRWLSKFITLKQNTQYTFKGVHTGGVRLYGLTSKAPSTTGTQIFNSGAGSTNKQTFNSGSYRYYMVSIYPSGEGAEFSEMQFEKGSSATYYEPYEEQDIELNFGKNLCKTLVSSGTYNGMTVTNNNGLVSIKGKATANTDLIAYFPLARSHIVDGETYTLSTNQELPENVRVQIMFYSDSAWVQDFLRLNWNVRPTDEARIPSTANRVRAQIWVAKDTVVDIKDLGVQIEAGEVATSYAPYKEPTELYKLGDKQDYLHREDGEWFIHREVGHIITTAKAQAINGSSSMDPSSDGAFHIPNWDMSGDYEKLSKATLSEDFGVYLNQNIGGNIPANSMVDGTFCHRADPNNDRMYFRNTGLIGKTSAEVNTLLNKLEGGINFWYPLDNAEEIAVSDIELIAQLDALADSHSYDGQTNVLVEAHEPNAAALLKVEAGEYR